MSKLLKCPFCGGEARNESCGNYWVKCTKCGSRGSVTNTEKKAINQWNTRTPMANIVEKLEEKTEFLKDCTKYGNESAEQQEKSYSTMMMYEVADLVDDLIDIVKQEINNGLE